MVPIHVFYYYLVIAARLNAEVTAAEAFRGLLNRIRLNDELVSVEVRAEWLLALATLRISVFVN